MSTFNSAAFAALLSSLSGTLAGFAVAGLIFVVALQPREEGPDENDLPLFGSLRIIGDPDVPLALLTSAFVGLILSSLAYALMAGEPPQSERLATEQVIAGAGFGTGGLILLLAVRRLVCIAAPSLNTWTRHVVGIGAPAVVWLYLAEGTRYVGSLCHADQAVLWLVLGAGAAVQAATSVVAMAWPRRRPMVMAGLLRLASVGVVIPTLCTLSVALTPTVLANDVPSPMWALYLLLGLATVGTVFFTLHVGRGVRAEGSSLLD